MQIDLEQISDLLPPEKILNLQTLRETLEEGMIAQEAIYKLNKKKLEVTVSERVKKGLYILEMRIIERPLINKETVCLLQKMLVKRFRSWEHYQQSSKALLSALVLSLVLCHFILPYTFFFQQPTSQS